MADTTPEATEAWLSILAGAVLAYRRDVDGKALAAHLKEKLTEATPLLRQHFGSPVLMEFVSIINDVAKGKARGNKGMPTLQYAARLKTCRQSMSQAKRLRTFLTSRFIDEKQAALATSLLQMFVPDTATVETKELALDKRLPLLKDSFVRLKFVPEKVTSKQSEHLDELKMLVKKFVKRNDVRLTPDEKAQIKQKYPDLYKRFNFLTRMVSESWKQFVRTLVRNNGGKPVKISTVLQEMKKANVKAPSLETPGLEHLLIGEDGKLYTSAMLRIVEFPPPGSKIVPNPKYDPKRDDGAVFWYEIPGSIARRPKAAYTARFAKSNKFASEQKIDKVRSTVPQQRDNWVRYLRSSDRYQQTMGAIVEILYTYAVRIGSEGNSTKGVKTFGLSTLRVGQARPRGGGYVLTYPGKDNKPQKHVIKPTDDTAKRVITVITRCVRGKKPSDPLWTKPDGSRITNGEINRFIKGDLKLPITSHKFRHIRGTNLMEELLQKAKLPKNASQKDAERVVKNLALKVGELLGHVSGEKVTAGTALKNYVVPTVIKDFFEKRGLRVPGWVPQRQNAS